MKREVEDMKTRKGKMQFKSTDEIEAEIKALERRVDSGTMKLVDEKVALKQITALNSQRKNFAQFNKQQATIDESRDKISAIRKAHLDDPNNKKLSEEYTELQGKVDALRVKKDESKDSRQPLIDERNALQKKRDEIYDRKRALQDNYFQADKAYRAWDRQTKREQAEKRQEERDQYEQTRRGEQAARRMEAASVPAFSEEIILCESLAKYFSRDSAAVKPEAPSTTSTFASRSVSGNAPTGQMITKKKDDDIFWAGAGGKKLKTKTNAAPSSAKLQLNMATIADLTRLEVAPPMVASEYDRVLKDLTGRLAYYKENQDRVTKEVGT